MHDAVTGGDDVELGVVLLEQRKDMIERIAVLFGLAAEVRTASRTRSPLAVLRVISGVAPMPSTWPEKAGLAASSASIA